MLKSPWRSIQSRRRNYELGYGGLDKFFAFDPLLCTFTPNMDKRATSVFATAPIVQGTWVGDGINDNVRYPAGDEIVNAFFTESTDAYRGAVSFWITPEWDGDDGYSRRILGGFGSGLYLLKVGGSSVLNIYYGATSCGNVDVSAWTAGTTYCVMVRWDVDKPIYGGDHVCVSVNDSHTFMQSSPLTVDSFGSAISIGSGGSTFPANAIIEGLTVYRRIPTDGDGGGDYIGVEDEIADIYAAGAGADPCLITKGSWDIPFCLPTNSTAEALGTDGEAWSHPHSSNLHEHGWMEDGGYLGGEWATLFNDTSTKIEHPDNAAYQNLSGGLFTVEIWFRPDLLAHNYVIDKGPSTGWYIYLLTTGQVYAGAFCDGASAISRSDIPDIVDSHKWHHYTIQYDIGGDRKVYIALDGKWMTYTLQNASAGAVTSDVGIPIQVGQYGSNYAGGACGWYRVSNNARYTVGTDFIPSRTPPASDGNTVLLVNMDEGTGATVDNAQGDATRDGTITDGTWERQWDQLGSPVIPYSVEFDGADTKIECGNHATIQDLHDAAFTAEMWIRTNVDDPSSYTLFIQKSDWGSDGWALYRSGSSVIFRIYCATTNSTATIELPLDGKWHHLAGTFDDGGDRIARIYLDGVRGTNGAAGVGAIDTDVAYDLKMGVRGNSDTYYAYMGAAWGRLSDSVRYTDDFVPPSRLNPPANDANAVAQWNFRDGSGTTLTEENGNSDGTITDGVWNITPDMEIDAPGSRIYQWGYTIGVDAVDEGILEKYTGVTAGSNRVHRPVVRYETDHRAQPYIEAYDDTNGASISKFDLPWLNGLHDGGNDEDSLQDSTAPRWPVSLVGATLYNITDASNGEILQINNFDTTDKVTNGVFAADTDWNKGDGWSIAAGVANCDGSQGGNTNLSQLNANQSNGGILGGIYYIATITVSNYVAGTVKFVVGSFGGTARSANGTYTEIIFASGSTGLHLYVQGNSAFDGDIDNVSIIPVPGIYAVLSGGTDDDWDTNDEYRIFPDPTWAFAEPWTFELPTIARNGVVADCVDYSIRVANDNDEGVFYALQMEQLENMIDNPSLETGAGNPWIPDGWTNGGLDPGDASQELTIVHSGDACMQFNEGAANEYIYLSTTIITNDFYCMGGWLFAQSGSITVRDANTNLVLHNEVSNDYLTSGNVGNPYWVSHATAWRADGVASGPFIYPAIGSTGDERYTDDWFLFHLDPVSLTVTPASEANCQESGGLRVVGRTTCVQPIPAGELGATSGKLLFNALFRHEAGDFEKFGNGDPRIGDFYRDANNNFYLYCFSNTDIRLILDVGGVATNGLPIDMTGLITPNVEHAFMIIYNPSEMSWYFDGTLMDTIVPVAGINFGVLIPNVAYWASRFNGTLQSDMVVKAP